MFKSVLLPIDVNHPESWEKALPLAKKLAGGGTLHVLGVVHDLGSAMLATYLPEGFEVRALQHMKQELDGFASAHLEGVANEVHVGHGHVPETILKTADAVGAEIIVMASHPPDDLRMLLVGSAADKVVRHANLPVLVVR